MKNLLFFLFILLLVVNNLYAQNDYIFFCSFGKNDKPSDICNLAANSFSDNPQAVDVVRKILRVLVLPQSFVILPCSKIEFACAFTPKGEALIRYILYNNEFMNDIVKNTSSWSNYFILAHEIGHHLCGHTLSSTTSLEKRREREIEADQFAGSIMYKLGATLKQSQQAVSKVASDGSDEFSSHPNLNKRLSAVKIGYDLAKNSNIPTYSTTSPSVEEIYNDGLISYENKEYTDALNNFDKVINLRSDYSIAYNFRGVIKEKLEDYNGAIEDFTKAIEISPEFSSAYVNRGVLINYREDNSGSIEDFTKAIEIDPQNSLAYINRGNIKHDNKNYDGAIEDYTIAIEIDSNFSSAYYNRGISKHESYDYRGAIEDFTRAIEIDSNFMSAFFNRGISKQDLKDYDGAIKDFTKVIVLNLNDADAYYNRGISKHFRKDYYGSIEDFTKVIEIDYIISGDAYYFRGLSHEELNNFTEACFDFKKSCDLSFEKGCEEYQNCK